MNLPREVMPRFARELSAHHCVHYVLAISFTLLLYDLFCGIQIYYCWHTIAGSNSDFCSSDRILNDETAGHHALASHFAVIFYPLLIPILAILYAPFYLVASYISRRWRIQQNIAGIIYWLVAWTLVGLSPLAIVAAGRFVLDVTRNGFTPQRFTNLQQPAIVFPTLLGAHGAICGIVYCILAFRRHSQPFPATNGGLRLH